MSPTLYVIEQEARRRLLPVTTHPRTGERMVDGLRADIWWNLKDKPSLEWRGRELVKEYK